MALHVLQLALVQLILVNVLQAIVELIVKYVWIHLLIYLNIFNIKNNLIDNACYNNPCLNGATCLTNGNTYTCTCVQYYSGTNCQTCRHLCYLRLII